MELVRKTSYQSLRILLARPFVHDLKQGEMEGNAYPLA
jgi:hypothetical protein